VTKALQDQLAKYSEFVANLRALKAAGFMDLAVNLAQQGPAIGAGLAKAALANRDMAKQANDAVKGISDVVSEVETFVGAEDIGSQWAIGFARGMEGNKGLVKDASQLLSDTAVKTAQEALKTGSPSKVMMKVGGYFSEGYGLGIEQKGELAVAAARGVALRSARAAEVTPVALVRGAGGSASGAASVAGTVVHEGDQNITIIPPPTTDVEALGEVVAHRVRVRRR
jgi:hypothetical protein